MSQDLVIRADDGGVRTITLNRPEKRNAMSGPLLDALSTAVVDAGADPDVRVVVIAGAGPSFCAGYDLEEETSPSDGEAAGSIRGLLAGLLEVYDLPQPVIASVQGHCLAGGCDLMMMCDLAIASDDAVFGQPEIRFGSGIVAHVMPWLIGARRAKELVLTGFDRLDATTAASFGLINRVVAREDLAAATAELAGQLAKIDPEVMRHTKKAINAGWERAGFREAMFDGAELGALIEVSGSPERVEFDRITKEQGLRAAIAWRDGRFSS